MVQFRRIHLFFNTLVCLLTCFVSGTFAQVNPELGDVDQSSNEPASAGGTESATGQWGGSEQSQSTTNAQWNYNSSNPSASGLSSGSSDSIGDDHDKVVGGLGIGFFGIMEIPIYGSSAGAEAIDPNAALDIDALISAFGGSGGDSVSAPTIGIRYWLSDFLGVEAALGIGFTSDSSEVQGTEAGSSSSVGFALHGGLPLAFAHVGHFVFEVVPELNLGISSGSYIPVTNDPTQDVDYSGFLLQLGGRAGAEIHFGFIDIPHLALQASVGLLLKYESRSQEGDAVGSVSSSRTYFGTTLAGDPWDIFTGNITAIYYIP